MTQPSFACPRCGYETFLPSDVQAGYCPMCRWWTGDSLLGSEDVLAQAEIDGPFNPLVGLGWSDIVTYAQPDRPRCSTCGEPADIDIMAWESAVPIGYACNEHGEIRGDGSGQALPELDGEFEMTPAGAAYFARLLGQPEMDLHPDGTYVPHVEREPDPALDARYCAEHDLYDCWYSHIEFDSRADVETEWFGAPITWNAPPEPTARARFVEEALRRFRRR